MWSNVTFKALVFCAMIAMATAFCFAGGMPDPRSYRNRRCILPARGDCVLPDYPNMVIKNGFTVKTPDCLEITCTDGGTNGCSFGWANRGVMGIPSDCKHKRVGTCGIETVKRADESQPCFGN